MIKKQIEVKIPNGMEARPVALFVQVASQYESSIYIEYKDKSINAKSIMGMMGLGLTTGDRVTLIVDGADEEEAVNELENYLSNIGKSEE